MNAEILKRAANELRATVKGAASPSLVSDPEFKLAVAVWLDGLAHLDCYDRAQPDEMGAALAVARAYLGEDQ